jgi:(p)ppGpp synthase/HD superfamily hydrolase
MADRGREHPAKEREYADLLTPGRRDDSPLRRLRSRSPVVADALAVLDDAYQTRLRRSNRTMEHPLLVGMLLAAHDQPPPVVAAGLLHDVVEDTAVTVTELRRSVTPEVAEMVQVLTQDESIADYSQRKAALRRQILEAGPEPSTVSLADKVAKLRDLADPPKKRKLAHYRATLDGVERRYGASQMSEMLRTQLARWPDA